jgi:hypothetical protein
MSQLTAKIDPGGRLILSFPAPTVPMSINKARGRHWAANRKLTEPWRDMAQVAMRQGLARWWAGREGGPCSIQVELPFRTAAHRDAHNYVGTNVKAVVDGLVKGGLVPDDTPEWVTVVDPALVIQRDKSEPLTARVIITPRSLT